MSLDIKKTKNEIDDIHTQEIQKEMLSWSRRKIFEASVW